MRKVQFDLIGFFQKIYGKFPPLSSDLKVVTVKLLPPMSLIAGVLIILASVSNFLGFAFISSFTLGSDGGLQIVQELLFRSVLGIVQGVIMIFAFSPLRAGHQTGWRLIFWSQILWIISALLGFSPWFVLGLLLLYPIIQVEPQYEQ